MEEPIMTIEFKCWNCGKVSRSDFKLVEVDKRG